MSYEFTLVLNREITDEESDELRRGGCAGATLAPDVLPTNAEVSVTRLDFETDGPSLAEVITLALEAVQTVPGLKAASLRVPAQPGGESPEEDASN
jgi:hypothetical protein